MEGEVSVPAVFKCPNLAWTFIVWLVVFGFFFLGSFVAVSLDSPLLGGIGFVLSVAICALAEYLTVTQMSDLVIEEQGISKSLFGRKWRTIRWGDVREIASFSPLFSGGRRAYRI